MFKTVAPSVLKELSDAGEILLTIKPGWEMAGSWSSKPSHIYYCLGTNRERIFDCYFNHDKNAVQVTNIEAAKLIKGQKSLIDAYMHVALKGLLDLAISLKSKRLIVDSYIPSVADHMFDLGFNVTSKGLQSGARGCKLL